MIGKILMFFTFPGAIFNTIIKIIYCRIFRVAVIDMRYFDLGTLTGYIEHEIPKKFINQINIVLLPFITGTLLGIFISFPGTVGIDDHGVFHLFYFILVWLGLSIVIHSIPKIEYAQKMMRRLWSRETGFFTKLICTPFLTVIYLANALTYIEIISVIFGLVVVYLPALILEGV